MMLTTKEVQELTGYSRDQLKRRLALLGAHGCDGVHRGARGALLIPEDLAKLLKRMAELEAQGFAPTEAMTLALDGAHERPRAQECTTQASPHSQAQKSSEGEKDVEGVLTALIVLQALNLFVLLVLLFFMTR
jgi:hypothetical protein